MEIKMEVKNHGSKEKEELLLIMRWPLYFRSQLTIGNLDSPVSLVTLWTKREKVAKGIDRHKYAVIGQLYSKDEGLNALIRNCLSNKGIRHIIITGEDITNSGEALVNYYPLK